MIATAPTMATSMGGRPSRIPGMTNVSSSTNVTASPTSAVTPRQRPNAITASANAAPNSHSGSARSWSEIW